MAPELVIFDCDGVLVDTEPVSNRVMAEVIREAGVSMSVEEVTEAFAGMRLDDIALGVEERLGKSLPEGWVIAFEERRAAEFRKGVEAIAGVADALTAIDAAGVQTCVASQASLQKVKLTLSLSGLIEHFAESSLFSSRMVERGKPCPDLFLLAAREMGFRPADCVVVEDGVLGARAGRRAGMNVLGYAPDGKAERLTREGAATFVSMARLPALLMAGDGAPRGSKCTSPRQLGPEKKDALKRSETPVPEPLYEELGSGYAVVRRPDPRLAQRIHEALGDAQSVVNVGAGTGSYEPQGLRVTAVEPSAEMIAQRPEGAAPAVQASAELLPFEADAFDAAMAVLTVHHWADLQGGIAEMLRVARKRVAIVTFDPEPLRELWIVRDYFPGMVALKSDATSGRRLAAELPGARSEVLPVPRDCTDLFFAALWGRPELFFDEDVVDPMWVWSRLTDRERQEGRQRLRADLSSGRWDERYGDLRNRDEFDAGLRIVNSEITAEG